MTSGVGTDEILIAFNDGDWRIKRNIVEQFAEKEGESIPVRWLTDAEKDVFVSLVRMERAGIQIDNVIDARMRTKGEW